MTARRKSFPRVVARLHDGSPFVAVGREAETLIGLCEKGPRGLRAYDFKAGPAYRLATYVHDLRRAGLAIRTLREKHETGHHGFFVLETPIRIVSVAHADQTRGASHG